METLEENVFKAIQHPKKLSVQIEEQLLNAINKGVFTAGDYLPSENQLVEIFNASRGVVRESLLMLSSKGIIEIQKGKRAKVLKPSIDTILESFSLLVNHKCGNNGLNYSQEVRRIIEPQIVECSAKKRKDEDIKKLEDCIDNMKTNKNDNKLLSFYDIQFHKIIWDACGNPMFPIILEPIIHFLDTFHKEIFYNHSIDTIDGTIEEHERILQAIKDKDGETAAREMIKHLEL